jgi:hypothetical protein
MTRTITHTYDSYEDASAVVSKLKGIGIDSNNISVIAHDQSRYDQASQGQAQSATTGSGSMMGTHDDDSTGSGAGTGAGVGSLVGGGAGLLAGLGLMAIPGIGPLVAAGWLASTAAGAAAGAVAGAATGGLIGALTDSGIEERDAHTYAEAVRRGSILISVRTPEMNESRVQAIMDRHNPSDLETRRAGWAQEGWTSYDPSARPYDRTEVVAEQDRYR